MSYKDIPGRPGWQFRDNPKDPGFAQSDLWETQSNGIRTFGVNQNYTETKRTKDPYGTNRGEISATYYNKEVKDASFFQSLPASAKMPDLFLDFVNEVYRTVDTTKTFDDMFDFTRSGNATMVDADGKIKWAPHNIIIDSEIASTERMRNGTVEFAGTRNGVNAFTIIATGPDAYRGNSDSVNEGEIYTIEVWIKTISGTLNTTITMGFGFPLSHFDIVATEEWQKFIFTQTANLSIGSAFGVGGYGGLNDGDVVQYSGLRVYRSDLGGMVNNPDPLDPSDPSYVPTTSGRRYLARRGHHIRENEQFVNKGLLTESVASTNLVPDSRNIGTFLAANGVITEEGTDSPAGTPYGVLTANGISVSRLFWNVSAFINADTEYTISFYARSGINNTNVILILQNFTFIFGGNTNFNLANGTSNNSAGNIEDVGNGWYRCSRSFKCASIGGSEQIRLALADNNDAGSTIQFYGFQLEESSVATSYIPTTGSTATRPSESLIVPAANMIENNTELSFSVQATMSWETENRFGFIQIYRFTPGNSNPLLYLNSHNAPNDVSELFAANSVTYVQRKPINNIGIDQPLSISVRHFEDGINAAWLPEGTGEAGTAGTGVGSVSDITGKNMVLFFCNVQKLSFTASKFSVWSADIGNDGLGEATSVI